MHEHTSKEMIDNMYNAIGSHTNDVYRFVIKYVQHFNKKRDYGTGDMLNEVETHIITAIADNPGITITSLTNIWGTGLSALSQMITKLEKRGFVERKKLEGNAKNNCLFVTEHGQKISNAHKLHDIELITKSMKKITDKYSTQELDTFYQMLNEFADLIDEYPESNS